MFRLVVSYLKMRLQFFETEKELFKLWKSFARIAIIGVQSSYLTCKYEYCFDSRLVPKKNLKDGSLATDMTITNIMFYIHQPK